jgi:hypothetical protein
MARLALVIFLLFGLCCVDKGIDSTMPIAGKWELTDVSDLLLSTRPPDCFCLATPIEFCDTYRYLLFNEEYTFSRNDTAGAMAQSGKWSATPDSVFMYDMDSTGNSFLIDRYAYEISRDTLILTQGNRCCITIYTCKRII